MDQITDAIRSLAVDIIIFINNKQIEAPYRIDELIYGAQPVVLLFFLTLAILMVAAFLRPLPPYLRLLIGFSCTGLVVSLLSLVLDIKDKRGDLSPEIRLWIAALIGAAAYGVARFVAPNRKLLAAFTYALFFLVFLVTQFGEFLAYLRRLPEREPDYAAVDVFFGTDRKKHFIHGSTDVPSTWAFDQSRGKSLTLGTAKITVPAAHVRGRIERPISYSIFGMVAYNEKEDKARHFTLEGLQLLTHDSFVRLLKEQFSAVTRSLPTQEKAISRALVFIHGYNVGFEAGLFRTAQIAYDLQFVGVPFYYSWPSQDALQQYEADRNTSEQSQPYLRQFIELIIQQTEAEEINVIAHSMGNAPLLRILKEMSAELAGRAKLNQIILAAPDVDRDIFEQLAVAAAKVSSGVTLYASKNDRAMAASRFIGGGIPRAGDVPEGGPVIIEQVDSIDASAASTELFSLNHSGYAESSDLLEDIQALLKRGIRPPSDRSSRFELIRNQAGNYWRLNPKQ